MGTCKSDSNRSQHKGGDWVCCCVGQDAIHLKSTFTCFTRSKKFEHDVTNTLKTTTFKVGAGSIEPCASL